MDQQAPKYAFKIEAPIGNHPDDKCPVCGRNGWEILKEESVGNKNKVMCKCTTCGQEGSYLRCVRD